MMTISLNQTEITLLFCVSMIALMMCSYLLLLSFRKTKNIPVIKSKKYSRKKEQASISSLTKNGSVCEKQDSLGDQGYYFKRPIFHYGQQNGIHSSEYESLPFVSVIVPARNESQNIKRCITSLLKQDYPRFEIIVVDDNSSDETLKIVQDIITSFRKTESQQVAQKEIKAISLKNKPKDWTGKTWAAQKGYLSSKGEVLLFTDADTYYAKDCVLSESIRYMQSKNIDVLTGTFSSEPLQNWFSKFAVPVWDFVSILFGVGSHEVNNPRSPIAYLMGGFFLIKRNIFINIGTFERVHDEIQEDKAMGIIVKKSGYNLKLVKLKDMVYTTWADDMITLWHGIGRTMVPLVMKNKLKVVINLIGILFATFVPFASLLFLLFNAFYNSGLSIYQGLYNDMSIMSFVFILLSCVILIYYFYLKSREYKMNAFYCIMSPFASIFLVLACLHSVVPLLIHGNSRPIIWQGRRYIYKKEQEGFVF